MNDPLSSEQSAKRLAARRTSGGSMTVGLPDEGKITEPFQGGKRLFMLKERATYEVTLADDIDPQRSNPAIPNVQQRIFEAGSDSRIIQSFLIQSTILFDKTYQAGVDCDLAREYAMYAAGEVLAMDRISKRVAQEEDRLLDGVMGTALNDGFIVPTLHDATQDTKNFLNRADHAVGRIKMITELVFGNFKNWESILDEEARKLRNGASAENLAAMVKFLRFVREARNSSEHSSKHKYIKVRNFEIIAEGKLVTPTIEIVHPSFPEPRANLADFMAATITSLVNLYASWIAFLCDKKASVGKNEAMVVRLDEQRRRYPAIPYAYAVKLGGDWFPIGV